MKRRDLEKHLRKHGCEPVKADSGRGPHDSWWNPSNDLVSQIPRKRELKTGTGKAICKELGVPVINKK